MASTISKDNPFPGADDAAWTQRLAEALSDYADWPTEVSKDIAAFIVRPKDLLTRTGGSYRLREEAVEKRIFESGVQHHVLKTRAHGFMGSPTEYNERVRSAFAAPAAPGATGAMLPRLATMATDGGTPLAVLVTEDVVDESVAGDLLEVTTRSMAKANGKRPWDMPGDLVLHGQVEPSMHAVLIRRVKNDEGQMLDITDPMAIIGNNRAQARQQCLGITAGTQLGVTPTVAGWSPNDADAKAHFYRPSAWAPRLARNLQLAWEVPDGEASEARLRAHAVAREAYKLATVPAEFVLAVTRGPDEAPVQQFERVVWEPNRISHRRQPLEYDPLERATAEVRALLSAYVDSGNLTEREAEWLAGDAPVPDDLIDGKTGLTNADVRDLRDLRLLQLIFPADADMREVARQTLGEPAPRHTRQSHVQQRHRLATAAITVGYAVESWNEAMNDGLLSSKAIREPWTPQDKSAAMLLRLANKDEAALTEFINTRGLNWLASHQLVFADRGSIGEGQKTKGLVRRTPSNMRAALLRNPKVAIGLFQELRRASGKPGEAGRSPREVDENGKPVPNTVADAHWFLETFPKLARQKKTSGPADPGPTRPKKPSKQEVLDERRREFIDFALDELPTAVVTVFALAEQLASAARAAGEPGFTDAQSASAETLKVAFKAVRQDARSLLTMLDDLLEDEPALDVECESATIIGLDEDEGDIADGDEEEVA